MCPEMTLQRPVHICHCNILTFAFLGVVTAKYKPPGARRKEQGGNLQLTRRVTGLINRLSDANIPQISAEILSLMRSESRRGVMDTAADLLLQVSDVLLLQASVSLVLSF